MPVQYILEYVYIPDVMEKRGPYREGHLGLAKQMAQEGTCLHGGPTGEPGKDPTGALFVFVSQEAAESYVKGDPYIANGIVSSYTISEWNCAINA
eukprot:Nitzschia sp. Nitz4//scaffold42_size132992//114557//114841//NITZ4_003419-RA/size132992-processed-gene-0.47-mRNA-1//-1//CDS//3329551778//1855//frame0